MANPRIPFRALTEDAPLAVVSEKLNPPIYEAGQKVENKVGDPKVEVVDLGTFARYKVTVKRLESSLAKLTEEEITEANRSRNYIIVDFDEAFATPYADKSGWGIAYSVKADAAHIVKTNKTATAATLGVTGFGDVSATAKKG
ncbi:hypothetical protein FACS1894208_06360 [Clostridia bacterium]|nr:hypothetical protein FACS1894208_06360 [Clostridia bacterium]